MASFLTIRSESALVPIRVLIGGIIVSHGVTHFSNGIASFGEFFLSKGISHGVMVAWIVSIIEIVGGISFVFGKFAKPLGLYFFFELLLGSYWIHWQSGKFIVEAGKNGIEYSILLIVSFLVVALSKSSWK